MSCMLGYRVRWRSFFAILEHFFPFYPENKILEKKKKTPRGITILKMNTINDNHIMHGSSNKESNRDNFLSFWTIFGPFNTLTTKNIKILKTWKHWIYYFTSVHHKWQPDDVWFLRYGEQWAEFFVILDNFFPLLTP